MFANNWKKIYSKRFPKYASKHKHNRNTHKITLASLGDTKSTPTQHVQIINWRRKAAGFWARERYIFYPLPFKGILKNEEKDRKQFYAP